MLNYYNNPKHLFIGGGDAVRYLIKCFTEEKSKFHSSCKVFEKNNVLVLNQNESLN